MPANRHQRRARAARRRRVPETRARASLGVASRVGIAVAGLALLVVPVLLLSTLHGSRVPRGLLLLPVVGCALLIIAWRG